MVAALLGGCSGPNSGNSDLRPAELYQQHCAACHGVSGEGTATGSELSDLTSRFGTATLRDIVLRGTGTMPGTPSLSADEASALSDYLRSTFDAE